MESAEALVSGLTVRSLWLALSALVLWLSLRGGWRPAPATRSIAGVLILLQGWVWFAIPLPVDVAPFWPVPAPVPVATSAIADTPSDATVSAHYVSEFPPRSTSRNVTLSGARVLLLIWLAGMLFLLGRSILGVSRLAQAVRRLPAAPGEWQHEVNAIRQTLSIRRAVELKLGDVAAPLLLHWGCQAWIVFPRWLWESSTALQRAAILRHELAHSRRCDPGRQIVMRMLALPHWFNPAAWWAVRQFEAAIEEACDEVACAGDEIRALEYSKILLRLNERLGTRSLPALALNGGALTERIRRLLFPELRKESPMSKLLLLSSLMLLVGAATLRIQAADPPASKPAPALESKNSLIPNGGFEELQPSGDPEAWFGTRVPRTADQSNLSVSTAQAHSGDRCVAVLIGDKHPAERIDYNWTIEAQGWLPGETYELSGWIKVENAVRPAVIMTQCWDAAGKRILGGASTEKKSPVQGTSDWTRVAAQLVIPEGTHKVRIRVGLPSADNPGAKAWFDDIALVPVAP